MTAVLALWAGVSWWQSGDGWPVVNSNSTATFWAQRISTETWSRGC